MTDYTITADAGAFTFTGVAAGIVVSRRIKANRGAFYLTGKAAVITRSADGGFSLAEAPASRRSQSVVERRASQSRPEARS